MMDVTSTRGRLVAMICAEALATGLAGLCALMAVTQHQAVFWAGFGAAVLAGFAAQFWFIAGLRRAKQGV